jgi:hypothetical protein
MIEKENPDAVFVDAVGIGAGVYDLLRLTNHSVIAANGADAVPEGVSIPGKPSEHELYYNMRACMWGRMRQWLIDGGCLPEHLTDLDLELQAPEYTYAGRDKLLLESKEHMVERGLASPDFADALSLSFFAPVRPKLTGMQAQQYAKTTGNPYARSGQTATTGWGGRR